ncbi:helix-turn-helix domain-containing protein [Desulfurispora thermophila]|uniref:helix-turn-helix domain-containing protein n=1 Tax=Desulfurispora thermophila TaxID=265470 RepID=UPI00037C0B8B|nr:helix-turn-helix transcriptional regulator [Desulfurispora thermophila]
MNYGERIRSLRKEKKLSAEKLGKLIGLSQSMISKLENDERKLDVQVLEAICQALGITMMDFFNIDNPLPPDIRRLVELAKQLTPRQRAILLAAAEEWAGQLNAEKGECSGGRNPE